MKLVHRLAALATFSLSFASIACPKSEPKKSSTDDVVDKKTKKKGDDEADEKKSSADDKVAEKKGAEEGDNDDDKTKDDDGAKKPPSAGHKVGGIAVPEWSKPTKSKQVCKLSKDEQAALTRLQKGDGPDYDDDTADVQQLVDGLRKNCPQAGSVVAAALISGGYTKYDKKDYAKADGWFARALVADPGSVLARYDLACNLALEGNKDESIWNFTELVDAAKADDPRAEYYVQKGKSDTDLTSVRDEDGFQAALKAVDADVAGRPKRCAFPQVFARDDKGKPTCIQVCSPYGSKGSCNGIEECTGAQSYGDDMVFYCKTKASLVCKDGELVAQVRVEDSDDSIPDRWEPRCVQVCFGGEGGCPDGTTCGGDAAIPAFGAGNPSGIVGWCGKHAD